MKRVLGRSAFLALLMTLAAGGFWLLFSMFKEYDDEGYVLLSLKNFAEHGGLYDRVYSQYGPVPFELYDALHRLLGFGFTNEAARWITLATWLGTALVCALMVGRRTRSLLWSAFTLAGTFAYLWVVIDEPIHPAGLAGLLVALGVWLGADAWRAGRIDRFALATAAAGATLLLTKINIGVFFFAATCAWFAMNVRAGRVTVWLGWLAVGVSVLLPVALMSARLDEAWVRVFALVSVGSVLGVVAAARSLARPCVTASGWGILAGTATATVVLLAAIVVVRGTTLAGLIDGVLLAPTRLPRVFELAYPWRRGAALVAMISPLFAAWVVGTGRLAAPRTRQLIAMARCGAAAVLLHGAPSLMSTSLSTWGFSYGLSLAWLFAVPLDEDYADGVHGWIALVLVFDMLQAYPVAGSQVAWGSYLIVPLLALGLADAAVVLRADAAAWPHATRVVTTAALVALTATMALSMAATGRTRFNAGEPVDLPGMGPLRLQNRIATDYQIVSENIRSHAAMLFTLPGLSSINLWTDVPAPTLANVTQWYSLLSTARQREIMDALANSPRAALLVDRDLVRQTVENGFGPSGALYDWLPTQFERAFTLDHFELWVKRGRRVEVLSMAQMAPGERGERIAFAVQEMPAPVARIELCDVDAPRAPCQAFDAHDGSLTVEPIDANARLVRVRFETRGSGAPVPRDRLLIVLRGATGQRLAAARMIE
jgi:hypothetical protein